MNSPHFNEQGSVLQQPFSFIQQKWLQASAPSVTSLVAGTRQWMIQGRDFGRGGVGWGRMGAWESNARCI